MALLAEPTARGICSAVVGLPTFGLVAAAEAGMDLTKMALIPEPGTALLSVLSALLDGLDLIVVGDTQRLRAADRQRLAAKARQKGAVLVATTHWPGADAELGGRRCRQLARPRRRRARPAALALGPDPVLRTRGYGSPRPANLGAAAGAVAELSWNHTTPTQRGDVAVPRDRRAG
jgi:hypothetical protein